MAFLSRFLLWQMHFWMKRLQEKNNQTKKYRKKKCIGWCHSTPSCETIIWYTEIDADTQRWKGYSGGSLQYRTWLFWLGIQSGGTQASAPQLCFLQLHVNSSKDFSFLGYIILISSECAQIYRALKFKWFTKTNKQKQNNKPTNTFEILRTNYTG